MLKNMSKTFKFYLLIYFKQKNVQGLFKRTFKPYFQMQILLILLGLCQVYVNIMLRNLYNQIKHCDIL